MNPGRSTPTRGTESRVLVHLPGLAWKVLWEEPSPRKDTMPRLNVPSAHITPVIELVEVTARENLRCTDRTVSP